MKGSNELYRLVYDYYATRILFGFYTYGDAMPSIHKICVQFRLAVPTVRTAFTYLERDGYIQVEASKVARVVYKAAPARIMKNIVDYFLPREDGLNDIGVAGRILIEPLFTRGLQRWEEDQWNQLREWLTNPSPDTLFMPIELYILALSALDNKLLLNLYWEMVRYLCFPYLSEDQAAWKLSLEELGIQTNEELIHYLKAEYFKVYTKTVFFPENSTSPICADRTGAGPLPVEPLPAASPDTLFPGRQHHPWNCIGSLPHRKLPPLSAAAGRKVWNGAVDDTPYGLAPQ